MTCHDCRIEVVKAGGRCLPSLFSGFGPAPDSDVDVLVRFEPGSPRSLSDLGHMEDELKAIFGREVDLGDRAKTTTGGITSSQPPRRFMWWMTPVDALPPLRPLAAVRYHEI